MPTTRLISMMIIGLLITASCNLSEKSTNGGIVRGPLGEKLDEYMTGIVPFGYSGALLVAKDGQIVLNKGYGLANRAEKTANTEETVFSTGSITKQFTAAAIMRLEMQGQLRTDDLISDYFESVPSDKATITLHHLLTHTSGLPGALGFDFDPIGRDSLVALAVAAPLAFEPGREFEYSNVGYSLLAAIIEKVSGQSYEEFLMEELFLPAGMYKTGYRKPDWDGYVVAHSYTDGTDNGTMLERNYPYWHLIGNGGILTTTGDMYKWHQTLLSNDILSDEAKAKIWTPYLNDYAYGWDALDSPYGRLVQHDGGSGMGHSAEFRRYLDSGCVTILFCNASFEGEAAFRSIRDKIETLTFGGEVDLPPTIALHLDLDFDSYAGAYELPGGGQLSLRASTDGISVGADNQESIDLLLFGEAGPPGGNEVFNRRSVEVFNAALEDDFEPFREILANAAARYERVRDFIRTRHEQYQEETGLLQRATALGTYPSEYEEGAVETLVRVEGERGSVCWILIWKDGLNIGLAPSMNKRPLEIPYRPVSSTEFAGYHLGKGRFPNIAFSLDNKANATAVSVLTSQDSVVATRHLE